MTISPPILLIILYALYHAVMVLRAGVVVDGNRADPDAGVKCPETCPICMDCGDNICDIQVS